MNPRDVERRIAALESTTGPTELRDAVTAVLAGWPWPDDVPVIAGHRPSVVADAVRLVIDLREMDRMEGRDA